MRGSTAAAPSAARHKMACVRCDRRAAGQLGTNRWGGKAEIVESCDQLIETLPVDGVDPFRVLDEHSDVEKRAGIGGDHRSVDAQGSRRVRLAAGVKCVVVDQLNPQLAAEGLGGFVDTGGSRHCDRQTLEHVSIVPVLGLDARQRWRIACVDNPKMTTHDCYTRSVLIHRLVWRRDGVHTPGLCCPDLGVLLGR